VNGFDIRVVSLPTQFTYIIFSDDIINGDTFGQGGRSLSHFIRVSTLLPVDLIITSDEFVCFLKLALCLTRSLLGYIGEGGQEEFSESVAMAHSIVPADQQISRDQAAGLLPSFGNRWRGLVLCVTGLLSVRSR